MASNLKQQSGFASAIAKEVAEVKNAIQSYAADGKKNAEAISALSKKIDDLGVVVNKIAALNNSLAELNRKLELLQAEKIDSTNPLKLVAIMPDRAWLEDSKGRSIAITASAQVEGYGKVLRIDSDKNKIYMSSGYVFE